MIVLTKVRIREPAVPSENPCLEADDGMEYGREKEGVANLMICAAIGSLREPGNLKS